MPPDTLKIGTLELTSRLFLGSSQYPDLDVLSHAIAASHTQLVTVALRRIDTKSAASAGSLLSILSERNVGILPNTAGCYSAREAVLTAKMAREALGISRIKLEVIGDDYSLYPDGAELLNAAQELIREGFEVFPYCPDDVVVCQRLEALGCVCVMPLAAPIGSGRGLANPYNLSLIRHKIKVPVIVDAGLGTASDACMALELGADAVLVNSAIAKSGHPVLMAEAFRDAVNAGRAAYKAKRIVAKDYAEASTPDVGKIVYKMK